MIEVHDGSSANTLVDTLDDARNMTIVFPRTIPQAQPDINSWPLLSFHMVALATERSTKHELRISV